MACSCKICHSQDLEIVMPVQEWVDRHLATPGSKHHRRAAFMSAHGTLGMQNVNQCNDCGFLSVDPMPGCDELKSYYQGDYAVTTGIDRSAARLPRYRRKIEKLSRGQDFKTFLDIGTNVGTTAEAARLTGLDSTGIDFGADAIAAARKRFPNGRYIHGAVQDFARASGGKKYDLVWMTEVIEHCPDPRTLIESVRSLVGRRLYLTTPDVGTMPRDKLSWKHLHYPEHVSLFSKAAMNRLLEDTGFSNIQYNSAWGTRRFFGSRMVLTCDPA